MCRRWNLEILGSYKLAADTVLMFHDESLEEELTYFAFIFVEVQMHWRSEKQVFLYKVAMENLEKIVRFKMWAFFYNKLSFQFVKFTTLVKGGKITLKIEFKNNNKKLKFSQYPSAIFNKLKTKT